MINVYNVEDGSLVAKVERVTYLNYNEKFRRWTIAKPEVARAVQIPTGASRTIANLMEREPYPWIDLTVELENTPDVKEET